MKNTIAANTLIQYFESFAPKSYALEGDKNGLMVGSLKKRSKKQWSPLMYWKKRSMKRLKRTLTLSWPTIRCCSILLNKSM